MTVSTSTGRIDYAGNGTTTEFSTTFKVLVASDISVWLVQPDPADSSLEIETLQTAYTVSDLGTAAAKVTMTTAPATGERLVIERAQPYAQDADYIANDNFSADQHETALDKMAMQIQRLAAQMSYKVSYPHLSQLGTFNPDLPNPDDTAVLGWQSGQLVNKTLGTSDAIQVIRKAERRHLGSELAGTKLTLVDVVLPLGINGQIVLVNGVQLKESLEYTVSTTTLIDFVTPIYATDEIDIYSQEFTTTAGGDASTITYTPAGTGAVATNVKAALDKTTRNFDTVAAMVADTGLSVGQYISVADYATGNESGVLFFKVVAAATGTADGGSFIDLTGSGLQAQQNFPAKITVQMFGAVRNDITFDNSPSVQAAVDYVNTTQVAGVTFENQARGGEVHYLSGAYLQKTTIYVPSLVSIIGDAGKGISIIPRCCWNLSVMILCL